MIGTIAFYMVLIISYLLYACCNESINLNQFKNRDSTTSCTKGLLSNDIMTVLGFVDFEDETSVTGIFFRYRPPHQNDFTHLCYIDVHNDKENSKECSFTKIESCRYKININYAIDANTRKLSGALLDGSLVTTTDSKRSNVIELPEFYDIRNTTGHLIVNGREYSTNQLKQAIVTDQYLNITFICKSPAEPCWIEFLTNDSKNDVQGKGSLVFERMYDTSQEIVVTLKFAACRLDREHNTIQFKVKIIVQDKADTSGTLIVLGSLLCCSILTIFVLSYFIYKYRKESIHYRFLYSKELGLPVTRGMAAPSPCRDISDEESPPELGTILRQDSSGAVSGDTENGADVDVHADPAQGRLPTEMLSTAY